MSADALVGRRSEIDLLSKKIALGGDRIVTIWGPGGIGKTRLARELARTAATAFPGGVTFASLEDAHRAGDLVAIVGRALGVTATAVRSHSDRLARIGRALHARGKTLLVLDNVEQIVDETCAALAAWTTAAPDASFMITSRELLGAPGESPCELAPLRVPRTDDEVAGSEAVELLMNRARGVRPDFDGNPRDLREIVSRLDGIPLAIELAAARLAVLSAEQLARRLDRRFDVLALRHGGAEARQRTLRGAIDWSWELLDDAEKKALAELSVFQGAFDLDAAEAVLEAKAAAASVLHALRTKSLLVAHPAERRDAAPRFSLLESIREYARGKLGDRASAVEARHAAYFVTAAEERASQVDGHDGEEALQWLGREQTNLLAIVDRALEGSAKDPVIALRAVLALEPMLSVHGAPALVTDLLGRIESTEKMASFSIELQLHALEAKAAALLALGQLQDAATAIESALDLSKTPLARARNLIALSAIRQARGRYDEAMSAAREALGLAEQASARREIGMALSLIALVHHVTEGFEEALGTYLRALEIHRETGHLRAEIRTRARLGFLMQDLGRSEEAIAECERAREAEQKLDSRQLEGVLVGYIGNIRRAQGRTGEAREHYTRAHELLRRAGDRRFEATFTMDRGIASLLDAKYTDAISELASAAATMAEVGDPKLGALIAGYEIAAHAAIGDREGAERALERATRNVTVANDRASRTLLDIHATQLDLDRARSVLASLARPILGEHRRIAAMLLERAMDRETKSDDVLLVARDGLAMRAPRQDWIDLSAHPSASRILAALVHRRLASPGTPMTATELVTAGWPGEKLVPSAGANRLRVLLTSLRSGGLRDILKSERGAYFLDPSVPAVWTTLEKAHD